MPDELVAPLGTEKKKGEKIVLTNENVLPDMSKKISKENNYFALLAFIAGDIKAEDYLAATKPLIGGGVKTKIVDGVTQYWCRAGEDWFEEKLMSKVKGKPVNITMLAKAIMARVNKTISLLEARSYKEAMSSNVAQAKITEGQIQQLQAYLKNPANFTVIEMAKSPYHPDKV